MWRSHSTVGYWRFDAKAAQYSVIPKRALLGVLITVVLLYCVVLMYEGFILYQYPEKEAFDVCVVGAGLSGAVISERYASVMNYSVIVLEKRPHIAGNCFDFVDVETGIRVNMYGAHLFHTNHSRVWEYVQKFANWTPYEHTVVAAVGDKLVPVPVNIDTVNALFSANISTSHDMDRWLASEQIPYKQPVNSEEVALSRVGRRLYDLIFLPYTMKQWNKTPVMLGPEVLSRIPVRNNRDGRYFTDPVQVLPIGGYTLFVSRMIDSPRIHVRTNTDYFDVRDRIQCKHTYFTGPIDRYFSRTGWPKLEYRSLNFQKRVFRDTTHFQTHSVVNHPGREVPYTRIVEYKHFLNQSSPHTVIYYETSTDTGDPYYPVPTVMNRELYARYQRMASMEAGVSFVGRLANYKYFDMDTTILNALQLFDHEHKKHYLDIIINQCREDLSWLATWIDRLNPSRVFVYQKCNGTLHVHDTRIRVVSLPNRGREGHTWLYHLLTVTDFARENLFLQGRVEVSISTVLTRLRQSPQSRERVDFWDFVTLFGMLPRFDKMPYCYDGVRASPFASHWMRKFFEELRVKTSNVTFDSMRCSFRGEMLVTDVDINNMLARIGRDRLLSVMNSTLNGEVTGVFSNWIGALDTRFDAPDMTYALERMWSTIFSNEFKQYN